MFTIDKTATSKKTLYSFIVFILLMQAACTQQQTTTVDGDAHSYSSEYSQGAYLLETGDAYYPTANLSAYRLDIGDVFDLFDRRDPHAQGDMVSPGGPFYVAVGGATVGGGMKNAFSLLFQPNGEVLRVSIKAHPYYPMTPFDEFYTMWMNETVVAEKNERVLITDAFASENTSITGFYIAESGRFDRLHDGYPNSRIDLADNFKYMPFDDLSDFLIGGSLESIVDVYGSVDATYYQLVLTSLNMNQLYETGVEVVYLDCRDGTSIKAMDDAAISDMRLDYADYLYFHGCYYLTLFEFIPYTEGMVELGEVYPGSEYASYINGQFGVLKVIVIVV